MNVPDFSWEFAKGMFLILLIYLVMIEVPLVAVMIYEERKKEVRYTENDCVGCPQGCIHCGRNQDYEIIECDECGKVITSEDDCWQEKGRDYCHECYDKLFGEEEEG